ncbi:MAG: ABC transporter permease subunit [Nitrospirae bacterium]|nr:ABC transporter permease subunit [Nitrospirota bacterium]
MNAVWLIARRELGAYMGSWLGYTIGALILFVDGLLFNVYALGGADKLSSDVLRLFFYFSSGTTMVASLFLSMRLLAEERQTGTIVVLYTAPVRDVHIVLGKFCGAFLFLAALTLATVYMPLLILVRGSVSPGHLAAGYLGLLLLGAATLSMGLFASSLTRSQLVSAAVGGALVVSFLLLWLLGKVTDSPFNDVFSYLALHNKHFEPFQKGVVNTRDIAYYLSVICFFLSLTTKVVGARRWKA